MCNFFKSECIDCVEHPDECTVGSASLAFTYRNSTDVYLQTCNFMFRCGEKRQCQYHGFRETMTMCHEEGEECDWPWEYSDDESDLSDDYRPYGELPDYPFNDEPETFHGFEPEQPHHEKPEKSHDERPHGKPEQPCGSEPKTPYGKPPVIPKHPSGSKGGEHPQAPYVIGHPFSTYGPPYNKGKSA
jgi:hypothetical protein